VIDGYAKLVDAHTVDIDGKKVTAETILVAVGGWPMMPKVEGGELAITSNEAFFLEERPKRVVVVGGGYIALEFAGIFKGYGAEVTQIYRGDMWLRGFDMDVRQHVLAEYKEQGIDVRFNCNIAKMEKNSDGSIKVTYEDGSTQETDIVMYATGRVPRTKNLNCEAAGVKLDAGGAIIVDEGFQTSVPSIYAVGDVINRIQLTPIALAEGHCLADTLFGGKPRKTDYSDVPTAVFSSPPIGTVGLTEEEARAKYKNVHIYRSTFRGMKHTISGRQEKTMYKLVVDADTDKVLGVHMVDPAAGEVIQLAGVCIKAGVTKTHFDSTIGVHPTAAEEMCTMRTRVPDAVPEKAAA
jgi:glutathione reductase (NADPH)